MFFKEGEMLSFPGVNIHKDYARYNKISRGIRTSKLGELSVEGFYRTGEQSVSAKSKTLELSLWRVTDNNTGMWERGVDNSKFVITKPNGERVSYVIVPRMNTDTRDKRPCEYTSAKDETFEDINDPRVIVIARSYKGVVAEIAKDLVLKNERDIRENYRYLADEKRQKYCSFSNPQLLTAITEQALQLFEPNAYQTFTERAQGRSSQSYYAYSDPVMQLMQGGEDFSETYNETNTKPDFIAKTDTYISENSQGEIGSLSEPQVDYVVTKLEGGTFLFDALKQPASPEVALQVEPAFEMEQ